MTLPKRLIISGAFGATLVRLVFSAADFFGDQTPALWLLAPGAVVGSFVMSGRVHELRFLAITVGTNVLVYGLLAERVLWFWGKRTRRVEVTPMAKTTGAQGGPGPG